MTKVPSKLAGYIYVQSVNEWYSILATTLRLNANQKSQYHIPLPEKTMAANA
jgi:hypothetical protein